MHARVDELVSEKASESVSECVSERNAVVTACCKFENVVKI